MCSTGRGLWGHSCPINPPDLSASSSEAARKDFFVFAVTCSRQRPAVCISLCSSFGCVLGNEMTLSVMHLAWLSRSWSLSVHLSCCVPVHYKDIYYQGWKDCGDWRSQLMVILRFPTSPPWLKRKSVLSVSLHPFLTFLYFPLSEKNHIKK